MTEPASRVSAAAGAARRLLSDALRVLQLGEQASGAGRAVELTASASSELYLVEQSPRTPKESFAGIRMAIDYLGDALAAVAELDDATGVAAESIAEALALLYPVARAQQRARRRVVYDDGEVPMSDPESSFPQHVPRAPRASGRARTATPVMAEEEQRRRGERVLVEADVGLQSANTFYTGMGLDISEGGLFVATYTPQPPGTSVTLYFVLPNGHVVHAAGTVRWTKRGSDDQPPGMGVKFDTLSERDLRAIESYCNTRPPIVHDEQAG